MKTTKALKLVLCLAIGFALAACSNPADDTQDARVSDAVNAVKDMTVDRYNAIAAAARKDTALRARLDAKFKKKAKSQQSQ